MSGIPEATAINLSTEERAELEGLARSTRRSTGCDSAPASFCLRPTAWRAGRSDGGSAARPARHRSGACVIATDGSPVSTRLVTEVPSRSNGAKLNQALVWNVRTCSAQTGRRILVLLDQPPPKGYGRWSGPLLAAALGDVDVQYVWRFLRAQKIDLAGRKSWCESKDAAFVAKA